MGSDKMSISTYDQRAMLRSVHDLLATSSNKLEWTKNKI
jgi:hypothetical protein